MGFVLSVIYLVTYYLTPVTVFGPLAAYRIELILAALIFFVSLPALLSSFLGRTPQSFALVGLAFATFLSVLIGGHWGTGGINAFLLFIPNAYAYFLVCLHCNSTKKLRALVLMMLFVCLFVLAQGLIEMQSGLPTNGNLAATDPDSSYFMAMQNTTHDWFYRLRGMGEIHDPNDFAQLIVSTIPLVFIFWRSKKKLRNFAFVLIPVGLLLYALFLTHSRGGLLAVLAIVVVALRKRVGTVPSFLLAGLLFVAMMALQFTGGRDISASAGEDRTELWSEGMEVLKAHPVFGVGFGLMPDYTGDHKTAHNSLVVCAAELGLFGLYCWSLFLFPTLKDTLAIASPAKVSEGQPVALERRPFPPARQTVEVLDKAEINRLGRLMILSFTGFLITGWFLSRAYVLTLFLMGGMTEAIFEMALERRMVSPRLSFIRVLRDSGILAVSLVVFMYIMLRLVNLTR